jgi:putative transposase
MSLFATAADLATLPGFPSSERRAREAAARMGLVSRPRSGRGGGLEYSVESLPAAARVAWAARVAAANDAQRPAPSVPSAAQARADGTAQSAHVTGWQKERQDAVARVLVMFQRFWQHFGGPLTPALHAFCRSWRANQVEAPLELRQRYPSIAPTTLRSWHLGVQKGGLAAITPKPHHRRGKFAALAGEVGNAALALLKDKPHLSAQAIYEVLSEQFEGLPSDRAFRRALAHWKQANAQLLEAMTNPDSWRNKYLSAAGNAAEGVNAPNQMWQMDSTPGDVMLVDGRRHAVIGVIDVYTRRRMFIVSRTSRSGAIMSLVRRAIAAWGVPAAIKTDNGSDYVAHQLEAALLGMAIQHPLCPPFTPQAKPHIERAIGALMHEHFELLDGFIGHDVAQRKGIEARRSFAERIFDVRDTAELRMTPEQLQASMDVYCDRLHGQPRDELGGRTPTQMAAGYDFTFVAERALDVLLAPSADGGIRVVGKKGIKISGGFYNHAELGGLEGTQVQVKVDEANLGRCWVFALDGQYICEALDYARLGISSAEVASTRRAHQRKVLNQQKRELKDATRAFNTRAAIAAITTERTQEAIAASTNVVPLQRAPVEHTSTGIASIVAADAPVVDAEQLAAAQSALASRSSAQVVQVLDQPQHRYARWLKLAERVARAEALSAEEGNFYEGYAQGAEWASMRGYFESFGLNADDVLAG